jgi:hypothetical protein
MKTKKAKIKNLPPVQKKIYSAQQEIIYLWIRGQRSIVTWACSKLASSKMFYNEKFKIISFCMAMLLCVG